MRFFFDFEFPCFWKISADKKPVQEWTRNGESDEVILGIDLCTEHRVINRIKLSRFRVDPREITTDRVTLCNINTIDIPQTGNFPKRVSFQVLWRERARLKGRHSFIAIR